MATNKKTPRSIWVNFRKFLGPSKPLPVSDLPTLRDCLLQVLLKKEGAIVQGKSRAFEEVATLIIDLWSRANFRLVDPSKRISDFAIAQRIKRAWIIVSKLIGKKIRDPIC